MRRHLWTVVLAGLFATVVLSGDARAWHMKTKKCAPTSQPCASPQSPAPQEECPPPAKCPPKKCCTFQIFPKHKSCFACPEKVVEPCIVPLCPAPPPPCPPIVFLGPAPTPQGIAPAPQGPSKQAF